MSKKTETKEREKSTYELAMEKELEVLKKEAAKNYFEILNAVNVQDKIEKKGKLSYLSWSFAWGELKKKHPDAFSTVYETPEGMFYFTDGKTCWVKTGVTVDGLEHIEYLPVMDNYNKSVKVDALQSTHANTAIQRSITKAIARHGLGLYIYAGEDLPEEVKQEQIDKASQASTEWSKDHPCTKEEAKGLFETVKTVLAEVDDTTGLDNWKKIYGAK